MESQVYDAFFQAEDVHWWFRARRRIVKEVLDGYFRSRRDLDIADMGCGTGGMYGLLNQYGKVTGVDESPLAREYCAKRGLAQVLSLPEWEQDSRRFDLITGFDVVEHIEDDVGFLEGLRSRLKPGGRVLATVPAYPFLWSRFDELNHHKRRYTKRTLRRSFGRAGYEIDRMTHFNSWLLPPIAAVRLAEKAFRRGPLDGGAGEDVNRWFKVGPLNGLLESFFASERFWLRRANLPAGCSIAVMAHPAASG